jgi:putative N6-adenine-specific DNA methylase
MVENEQFPMIAKTLAELEDVLAEELIGLGADNVVIGTRMVSFTGDNALMYKANLHCRTALRILKPIYEFKAETADEVYEAILMLSTSQQAATCTPGAPAKPLKSLRA